MSVSVNNGGELTSLIHRSSDKLSSILGARRPPPFLLDNLLPRLSRWSLLPFTTYTRMARANRLISQDLIWRSIKIFANGRQINPRNERKLASLWRKKRDFTGTRRKFSSAFVACFFLFFFSIDTDSVSAIEHFHRQDTLL